MALCTLSGCKCENSTISADSLLDFVDPLIGTGGHGHTFPGAAYPFGMVQLSPDTGLEGWDWCSGYHYSDSSIIGFSHTHLSGTGRSDLMDVMLMPVTGNLKLSPGSKSKPDEGYRSRFSHDEESASPGYYKVRLKDYDIMAELTVSPRCGFHRYTFPESESSHIILDLSHHFATDSVLFTSINKIDSCTIIGERKTKGWGEPVEKYWSEQQLFFALKVSKVFDLSIAADEQFIQEKQASGKNIKAILNFETSLNEMVLVKVGISAVSAENALQNLSEEIPHWDFNKTLSETQSVWEKELSKIKVGAPDKNKTIFYTALYHSLLAPYLYNDVNKEYLGFDKQTHMAEGFDNYTVLSLWDTFRAENPLLTLIAPDKVNDLIQSMLAQYEQYGLLPVWPLWSSETNCMIGYHAVPVIVDAYMKGYRNFDAKEAYKACLRAAEYDTTGIKCPDLVLPHLMPKAKYYKNAIGYIPCDRENESVAKALEYAYDDWCISIFAEAMSDFESKAKYERFAKAYEFYFDKSIRFMRGLDSKGEWRTPFNPRASTHRSDDYCEGTAWQWTWFVPHDVEGLVNLMGGEDAFVQKLDSLFSADSSLEGETTSSDISGLIGQYAHGNEPSHHVIHLYNYVNRPWRTQELVDSVYRSQYANSIDGLSGNEDCGQMSAWYILNSMGFYQVCPGKPVYSIGRPAFDKAVINLPEEKTFSIVVKNNGKKNKYIESVSLNGKALNIPFFNHQDIANGGTMEIKMTDHPTKWGVLSPALSSKKEE